MHPRRLGRGGVLFVMFVVAIGFAAGAWWLQQAAALPSGMTQCALAAVAAATLGSAAYGRSAHLHRSGKTHRGANGRADAQTNAQANVEAEAVPGKIVTGMDRRTALLPVALTLIGCALAGYDWAAWRAERRLASSLPAALEGRDIRLSGRVVGLPVRGDDGVRFLFRVDALDSPLPIDFPVEAFAERVQLSWSHSGYRRAYGEVESTREASAAASRLSQSGSPSRPLGPSSPPSPSSGASSSHRPTVEAGQRWALTVRLKRPRGYANFLARDAEGAMLQRGVRATGYVRSATFVPDRTSTWREGVFDVLASIDRMRATLAARIAAVLHDGAHRGVITALAIGDQGAIDPADRERFTRTGTNHLVAISGLHVGLVAGFAALLGGGVWRHSVFLRLPLPLWWPSQRIAACCGIVGAAWFVALAGFGIPAQRAFWMLAAVFAASLLGRSPAASIVIAWALLLVVAVDPWAVTSAGFWLSFGAVGAILFSIRSLHQPAQAVEGEAAAPPLTGAPRQGVARRPSGPIRRRAGAIWRAWRPGLVGAARAQMAVTIALVPATATWFGQVPLLAPFANAIAIPWVSFLVVPPVLAGVVLPAPVDAWAFLLAHQLMAGLSVVLQWFAAPQWGVVYLPRPDGVSLVVAVIGVVWWLGPRGLPLQRLSPILCLPLFLSRPAAVDEGEFRVTMLDVGQGMSALVETRGHRLLYDTGPPIGRSDAGERLIVPHLTLHGITGLDTLVVSHNHDDHYSGAGAIMERVTVGRFLASLPRHQPLWATAARKAVHAERCVHGQSWQWDGVVFQVLWPIDPDAGAPPNDMSCVIRVSNGMHALLLAGDIEREPEAALVRMAAGNAGSGEAGRAQARTVSLRADILLAPHHGSATSSSEQFLDAVAPSHAIFQMGYRNRHHHPSARIVPRYVARGVAMYRSDADGAVRFESHGEALHVDVVRRNHRRYWMDR